MVFEVAQILAILSITQNNGRRVLVTIMLRSRVLWTSFFFWVADLLPYSRLRARMNWNVAAGYHKKEKSKYTYIYSMAYAQSVPMAPCAPAGVIRLYWGACNYNLPQHIS
jgi:hypothetical protein